MPEEAAAAAAAAAASSEEDLSGGELESFQINQDSQLKEKLLQKYRGYISNLKHEFSKSNKKKGKLPKESRQILLNWWNVNYQWPYPTVVSAAGIGQGNPDGVNWTGSQTDQQLVYKPKETALEPTGEDAN
ncbi:hypothetical protein SLEP1_g44560 [Rubroshorea leprosula]|uniref:ELK domain-containing protein n=1 Tax=Rubroshorea leprosula TaxID=152421 RepID=A0AAV5LGI6_9ROSI|nr:hypothetical protein SLEP1_g44560 [Rubroshorea leprosula]